MALIESAVYINYFNLVMVVLVFLGFIVCVIKKDVKRIEKVAPYILGEITVMLSNLLISYSKCSSYFDLDDKLIVPFIVLYTIVVYHQVSFYKRISC